MNTQAILETLIDLATLALPEGVRPPKHSLTQEEKQFSCVNARRILRRERAAGHKIPHPIIKFIRKLEQMEAGLATEPEAWLAWQAANRVGVEAYFARRGSKQHFLAYRLAGLLTRLSRE